MTRLDHLDGPATAAISEQLVDVYRAAMGAAPFHETEVETGWFAEELAGELTEPGFRCWVAQRRRPGGRLRLRLSRPPRSRPTAGTACCATLSGQGPDGAGRWLEGQFAVVWIAVHPDRRGRGIGRALLERLLAGAGTDRAWLITHDLDTPAQALYRSLGFQELGRGPLGWHDAERVVLGADLS